MRFNTLLSEHDLDEVAEALMEKVIEDPEGVFMAPVGLITSEKGNFQVLIAIREDYDATETKTEIASTETESH